MKRLQIYYPENLLEDLRIYAEAHGMPLAETLRLASREFAGKPQVSKIIREVKIRKAKSVKNPLFAMAGMLKAGPAHASASVDDIYEDEND